MKKNFLLLIALVSISVITSCNSSKKVAGKGGEISTLMIRSDLKRMLGPAYYVDSMIYRLHLTNTAEVSWNHEVSKTKVKADIDENGIAQSLENQKKESIAMILPPGVEGEPDSVTRFPNREISAIRVHYIIKQTGKSIHLWYYSTADIEDPATIWFQSKDNVKHIINGVALNRVTLDNRLLWKFHRESKSDADKTLWDVTSPFANKQQVDSVGKKTKTVIVGNVEKD